MWKVYFQEKLPFLWYDALEFPAWLLPLFYCWKAAPFVFGLGVVGFIAAATYSWYSGDVYYNVLILKMGFWFIIAFASSFVLGVLVSIWEDLVKERRNEKGQSLTIQEVIRKELDFERWCS
ncbi:hypothetical protein [Neomoorella thermoacetica]|uniref:hypothetical protein n=1 Tax=Neomoorella thermoacetica TaxID=1525 RepID=UPI0008FBB957|nr:hypothetical protein [Moorella thermoacetica]OIQ53426.1 hypothetical protein MORE_21540 [Moorella thermoacetica]